MSDLYEAQDRPNYVMFTFDQDTLGSPARLTSQGTTTVSSFLEQTWAGSSSLPLLDSSYSLGLGALVSSFLLWVETFFLYHTKNDSHCWSNMSNTNPHSFTGTSIAQLCLIGFMMKMASIKKKSSQ